ncbi:hypothetical protein [Mycobacteroides abscessus]|uniref:Uncharacterized protein n=1 Tax=Mycolicibacterium mageritense TaxID=53462 RepID=A0ABM7HZC2_MYCME|nr:hypothetical protein [Mycobacteroides abscessus]MDO3357784.1 hypothetical protein [Mycobacteroides abscessus subsp. massiliense]WKE45645.1 hypothetical protein P3M63_07525 [Mycobacteroides abscessus subsp. massiliense]BBX35971.1 hypothetical protein MMAGJ_52530 [Mycolicibacterium mageritense]CDO24091.1 hypothetical protein BN978_04583 [Mycolicibacterium mageritense DSM 44476 = CIP 104973]
MRISTIIALGSLAAAILLGGLSAALGGTATKCTPVQRPRPDGGFVTLQDCAVGAVTPGKLFAGIAGLCFLVAVLAGFVAVVSALTRPMDRALSPTVSAAADGGARAAAAARQAHAARAERRQQQGYGGYSANSGGGYGTGYIDAEVVDFPETEDWLNTDPVQPEPSPSTDDRPRSGWGRGVQFGD